MKGSLQETLGRVRPPRVQITYDVELGDAIEMRELPFIVGIMADLSGEPEQALPPLKERSFVMIDRDNIDTVMSKIRPRLNLNWPDQPKPPAAKDKAKADDKKAGKADKKTADQDAATKRKPVELFFESMDDFYPTRVIERVDDSNVLYQERKNLRDLLAKLDGNDVLNALINDVMLDESKQKTMIATFSGKGEDEFESLKADEATQKLLDEGGMMHEPSQEPQAKKLLGSLVTGVIGKGIKVQEADKDTLDCVAVINTRVLAIDEILSDTLNAILHHPDFQRLEASWRGLHYLVMNTETSMHLKLRLLNASKDDLFKDLTKAVEFDQSALFKMIYEKEYGTFGGEPYSVLVGDYEVGRLPNDIKFLELMSQVAAAAHAPFITNAYSKLFDMADFASLHKPRDLSKIFESQELIKWRSFRETEDSRYVTMTLPRVLTRLPYDQEKNPVEGIIYDEQVDGTDAASFLWSGSAFALVQRITNAFALYGWTAAIRGVEGGGLIEGLPTYTFNTTQGDIALTCPTEVAITDRREKELNDLGFMAICHCKGTDKAAFFGGQSTNQPKKYNTDEANANSAISSMLPYVLSASRFAHYIKVIMRDKIGSFMTRGNVEDYLNTWIAQYVLLDDSPPQDIKARYPLRQARVAVSDVPGKPGSYRATVFLKPHFQLEELTTSIRLVAELPS
ncbi:MAG: type VI secretion system contractile sheath large subunit [Acidiferrobacterales bacterium]|nr:type VI secretion system contractile sheath large subunit [Acidiferrobacterales bacterium]